MQVDALGGVRTWEYDDNGNVTAERAYDTAITQPLVTDPKPTPTGAYRETTYSYDRANRLTSRTINEQLRTGSWNGSYLQTEVGTLASTRAYDKAGNVVKETDAAGASAFYYYDALGRVSATVDAELYLTVYERDAEGNDPVVQAAAHSDVERGSRAERKAHQGERRRIHRRRRRRPWWARFGDPLTLHTAVNIRSGYGGRGWTL